MQQYKLKKNINNGITCVKSDGNNLYFGGALNSLQILNSKYDNVKTLNIPSGVIDLQISENFLAVNNFTSEIRIFDLKNLDDKPKLIEANACDSWKIQFDKKQQNIYTGGTTGNLHSFDINTLKQKQFEVFNKQFLQSLCVLNSGQILTGSADGQLALVNETLDKKTEIKQKLNFGIQVIQNCVEEGKNYIASKDGKILFFDCQKQEFIEDKLFEGHSDMITDLVVQTTHNRFLTCSLDKTVKLWDERSGFIDSIQLEEDSQPWGITLLEQSQEIVVGLEDGNILVYENIQIILYIILKSLLGSNFIFCTKYPDVAKKTNKSTASMYSLY